MLGEIYSDFGETTLRLRRVRPEKNERRFYSMIVTVDLFGDTLLLRNWGRPWDRWQTTMGSVR